VQQSGANRQVVAEIRFLSVDILERLSGSAMLNYPALLDLATQALHPLGVSESFLVGRNETADICVFDRTCSRHHFRIVRRDARFYVESLSTRNHTYHNGQPVTASEPLEHGAVLQAGLTRFQFLLQPPSDGTNLKAADAPAPPAPTLLSAGPAPSVDDALGASTFPLAGAMLIGREQARVQIFLPHPQVSRVHAHITLEGKTATLTDLRSANGTFVNGQRITAPTTLRPGDQLDIGPYALQFTGAALIPRSRTDNVELIARGIRRVVRSRETGQPLTLLDDITLVIRPREFVCLLGPSGSGKSTLLSALSGRTTPDGGAVLLNGKDLHANFEALKQDIAVVPQKDVLHDSLAVGQALWYTAMLRLPPDTSAAEIESSLTEMLQTVGLTPRRATVIRHLSGGQVKRASLANEILCKPSLLFLDEVTSGLDEQTDREVMNLFRSLADAGKTVVCITHSLANVERTCHLVVILTPGGKLAFIGKPAEALKYFSIDRLGDVYDRLADHPAEHWQQVFLKSPYSKRYVADRLPPETAAQPAVAAASARAGGRMRQLLRQTALLTARYAAIWRGDYTALLAMMGQALVVAVLLGLLFGNLDNVKNDPLEFAHSRRSINLMFLLAVSSFWFGCNNAAKEIVKERTIYSRERDFNLRVGSYYASKLVLLTVFSGLQTVLLFLITRAWCHPPGPLVGELIVLLALALAGVTLGLAISALAASEEVAITLIPMAVIPQIILSGAISPLEGISKVLALAGISTYWGKRGLDACLPEDLASKVDLEQHDTVTAVLVLLAHAAVAILVALAVLHWQNRRGRGLGALLGRVAR
jgi:ABC-type multidrug transport system ATPase subunit/pSer/pThr/pTyr-binding forkhead associated (FHA) protein/ABC-type multidrug transport system permease subunit